MEHDTNLAGPVAKVLATLDAHKDDLPVSLETVRQTLERTQAKLLSEIQVSAEAYAKFATNEKPSLQYTGDDNEILIYGLIVSDDIATIYREWFGDESVISARMFKELLADIAGDVLIRINSPGGDAFECSAIVQAIQERNDDVSCMVDGLAASAASLIMASCRDVTMAKLSMVMIHCASSFAYGNAKELKSFVKVLEEIDQQAVSVYRDRMDKSDRQILNLMEEETWFSAENTVKEGLADQVYKPKDGEDDDSDMNASQTASIKTILADRNKRFTDYTNTMFS